MNKKFVILMGMGLALLITISRSVSVLAWGPERSTYTMENPSDHAVFNSITDSSSIGDERDFVRIVEKGINGTYSSEITLEPDKQYDVYIYYHNNASSTFNDKEHDYAGAATDVRLSSSFPLELAANEEGVVSGIISWATIIDCDEIQKVWDEAYVTATEDMTLHYVEGSAKIYNGGKTNGNMLATNLFSEKGTYLGYDELNGIIPGCDEYAGHVNYTIQTQAVDKKATKPISTIGIFVAVAVVLIIAVSVIRYKRHKKI